MLILGASIACMTPIAAANAAANESVIKIEIFFVYITQP
jgi:hypothetical protein